MERSLGKRKTRLAGDAGKLNALNPLAILARGYASVRDAHGQITQVTDLTVGQAISVRFADGEVNAVVHSVHPTKEENKNGKKENDL